METKHTPGPWHVGQGQNAQIIYDKDGWGVANAVVYHRHHEPGSTIHNAKLIAAAPDLLAALQAFDRIADIWLPAEADEGYAEEMFVLHKARNDMLVAIAKATE